MGPLPPPPPGLCCDGRGWCCHSPVFAPPGHPRSCHSNRIGDQAQYASSSIGAIFNGTAKRDGMSATACQLWHVNFSRDFSPNPNTHSNSSYSRSYSHCHYDYYSYIFLLFLLLLLLPLRLLFFVSGGGERVPHQPIPPNDLPYPFSFSTPTLALTIFCHYGDSRTCFLGVLVGAAVFCIQCLMPPTMFNALILVFCYHLMVLGCLCVLQSFFSPA